MRLGDRLPDPTGRGRECVVVYMEQHGRIVDVVLRTTIDLTHPNQTVARYIAAVYRRGEGILLEPIGGATESDSCAGQIAAVHEHIRKLRSGAIVDQRLT